MPLVLLTDMACSRPPIDGDRSGNRWRIRVLFTGSGQSAAITTTGASTATTRSGAHTPGVVKVSAIDARTRDAVCCAAQRAATDAPVVIDHAALVVGVVEVKPDALSAALATPAMGDAAACRGDTEHACRIAVPASCAHTHGTIVVVALAAHRGFAVDITRSKSRRRFGVRAFKSWLRTCIERQGGERGEGRG